MDSYDIIVIGGGVSALNFVRTIRALDDSSKILIIRKTKRQVIPCVVPYMVNTISLDESLISDEAYTSLGVDLLIDEVVEIDRMNKLVVTRQGKKFKYKKLIIATGTKPVKLKIKGIDLRNVFLVNRDYDNLRVMINAIKSAKKIAIVGAGFVGMEFADDLADTHEVYIIEILNEALPLAFDPEFGAMARQELEKRGVRFILGKTIDEIIGNGKVEAIIVGGEKISVDVVIISVGILPNTEVAQKAGIACDGRGHIIVDSFMRTSDNDIYAIGDIAQKRHYLTNMPTKPYFAPLATLDGRIAALSMLNVISLRNKFYAIAPFLTKIGDLVMGAVGLTETMAKKLGIEYTKIDMEITDKHPPIIRNTKKVRVKVLFGKDLKLIGVQAAGSQFVSEIINHATIMMQLGLSAYEIVTLQYASHPKVTPSPSSFPLQRAALEAIKVAVGKRC